MVVTVWIRIGIFWHFFRSVHFDHLKLQVAQNAMYHLAKLKIEAKPQSTSGSLDFIYENVFLPPKVTLSPILSERDQ